MPLTVSDLHAQSTISLETVPTPLQRLGASPTILVVDDNAINRKIIRRQIQSLGFDVDEASDGLEALDSLAQNDYSLVLMDCQMPRLDGYDATRCLRIREGTTRRTAVVAVTANTTPGNRKRCLAAGMDDFLSKPVTPQILEAAFRRWLPAD